MKKQVILIILLTILTFTHAPTFTYAHDTSSECLILVATLRTGSFDSLTDHSVKHLQDFLRTQGLLSSKSTGYFGNLTAKAVKDFQVREKLDAVGILGPKTRSAVQRISCAPKISVEEPKVVKQTTAVLPTVPIIKTDSLGASVINAQTPPKNSLPYKSSSFSNWKGNWGSVANTESGSLYLKSTANNSGAEAVFPDSKDWTDYRYTANIVISNGDVTLISRYKDENNFLGCTFSANWVGIIERLDGNTRTVASAIIPDTSSAQYFAFNTIFSMKAKGKVLGCIAVGAQDNVTYTLDENHPLMKGAIGISTWGIGGPTLELREVSVEKI